MKRTFTINLNSIVFHVDEDAYEVMLQYLGTISTHFQKTEEGKEILADIESRIAELFQNRLKEGKEVITTDDVDWMIQIMGKAEEVIGEDAENISAEHKTQSNGKRFYRDGDDKILGGVCSGISKYFNMDPVILRVILAVLFFVSMGTVVIVYLLLWFILPEAKTTAQKLEMKGVKVNIENIEKTIRQEFDGVRDNFQKMKDSPSRRKINQGIKSIFHALGKVILVFAKSLGIILGISFLIAGLVLIVAMSTSVMGNDWFLDLSQWGISNISFAGLLSFITEPSLAMMAFTGFLLLVGIPAIALVYMGIKLLFGIHLKNRIITGAFILLWVLGFVFLFISASVIGSNFHESVTLSSDFDLDEIESDTFIIKMYDNSIQEGFYFLKTDEMKIGQFNKEKYIYLTPGLSIEKINGETPELQIDMEAHGKTKFQARKNAQNTKLDWQQNSNGIAFSKYFSILEGEKWRNQEIDYILKLPVGQIIYLDESLEDVYIATYGNILENEYHITGNYYIMSDKGLKHL
ncbi:MAG: PspC domain-containing protein [Bacteroidetes bacterium]|nr:PspC domain-containing protein [Bacteroidota bacterium]